MQPTFRQVPPKVPDSMIATPLPSKSGVTSELPDPVPMIARSKSATAASLRRDGPDPPISGSARLPCRARSAAVRRVPLAQQHDEFLLRAHSQLAEHRGQVIADSALAD